MKPNLLEIIKKTNSNIIKELSPNHIYIISNTQLHHNNFLISTIGNKIFISITIGEFKNKYIKEKKTSINKSNYIKRLCSCWKDSKSEKYRPMQLDAEDLISKLENHETQEQDEESINISAIDREYDILISNNIIMDTGLGQVDKYLLFKFNFEALEVEHKFQQIQIYIESQKQAIERLIK